MAHFFIIGLLEALLIPVISDYTESFKLALIVGLVLFIVYWVVVGIMATTRMTVMELMIVVTIFGILLALVMPIVHDPQYQRFLRLQEQQLFTQGDVIIKVQRHRQDNRIEYQLVEIWRNRLNRKLPWSIGDKIDTLTETVQGSNFYPDEKIVFFHEQETKLERIGGRYVRQNAVYVKQDIGVRRSWERWLNRKVPLDAFKNYLQHQP